MRRLIIGPVIFGLACNAVFGRPAPGDNLAFEVASVKPHLTGAPTLTGRTGIEEDASLIRIEISRSGR